ncbi:hypothetical protein Tco_1093125 [Tanacetum coccineum]|uniref:Uncharacterized protein n=1 Tax=Tanacetum coccineum TaxID=301880 RepID=A0ABQ5IBS6_9ASTR
MDFNSFILEGIDGEFNFLPAEGVSEGRNSPSAKSMNNDAPMISATPLSSVYPSNIVENVADSDDPSYGEDEQTLVASKVADEASTPLDVDSNFDIHEFPSAKELRDAIDYYWVVAHVTPPSWKQHLREISIEQLCDIHDMVYMRQAVLDKVLNSITRELISILHKAKTSYDAIRERELEKDRAYAELERKDKWMDFIIFKSERERLKSSEIQLLKEIDNLKKDRAAVVSKVIPDVTMKLVRSDDLEVAAMKEPFVLEKMSGYRPSSKEEYGQAGDALANASYPFLAEYVINPYASLEQLL